jgi:type II restriction enzyme
MSPGKEAKVYWSTVNQSLIDALGDERHLWDTEKVMSLEGLNVAKAESLRHLTLERDRVLRLSHREALEELIRNVGVDSRIARVKSVQHGELLGA